MESGVTHCSCCKEDREKHGKSPRKLQRLPLSVVQDELFAKKKEGVYVCEFCDGDSLPNALRTHKKRRDEPDALAA